MLKSIYNVYELVWEAPVTYAYDNANMECHLQTFEVEC